MQRFFRIPLIKKKKNKMKFFYSVISIVFLFFACRQAKQSELPEFQVDTNKDIALPLSEITDEIMIIEPELTDESLINYGYNGTGIRRMIKTENHIIVAMGGLASQNIVLVFNLDGKFVRSIGTRGQGPGEHNLLQNMAFDDKNRQLFILSADPNKIICYHLDGMFVKESRLNQGCFYFDINYFNNELFFECFVMGGNVSKKIVYRMNNNLQLTDSIICWKNSFEGRMNDTHIFMDYLVKNGTSMYVYPKELYMKWNTPNIKVLRDTLYRVEDNQLIPELKLKFRNNGFDGYGDKIINLHNLYRSSRYIFAFYEYNPNNRERTTEQAKRYFFCYDTKTGQGYNMLDGYKDDIHGIEERVYIHPLTTDSEYFYYCYPQINPNDREEPNPTLYIGKLKK